MRFYESNTFRISQPIYASSTPAADRPNAQIKRGLGSTKHRFPQSSPISQSTLHPSTAIIPNPPTLPPPASTMPHMLSLLSRPSTLGFLAVAGSGAFYVSMKGKTMVAKQQHQGQSGSIQGAQGAQGVGEEEGGVESRRSYHVNAGERSGGGV